MKKYILILIALIAAFQLNAQYTIQVGSGGSPLALPYTNQYEYNWCSVIYPQDKIKIGGDITKISYWLYAYTVSSETAYYQEIYMAHTSDVEFSDAGYPDTASMSLVYHGVVYYRDSHLGYTEITLTTPFAYNNSDNLIIHIENHDGNKNSDPDQFLYNPSTTTTNYPCKYNQQDGSFPETTGSRTHQSPNVFLTFDSGLDVGISKINDDKGFILPGLQDVKVNFANYMADVVTAVDIDWEINGTPQTTYNWTGSLNPGQESADIIIATDYDFNPDTFIIKAWTANPNAGTDELNTNDTLTKTIFVADYIEIGDHSYNNTIMPYPTYNYFGWSASIYNSDSIQNGKICGIAYNNVSQGYFREDQKIYMSQTTETTFSSADLPTEGSMSKVYSGDIDYGGTTGWKKIKFDSIFIYDNNNLQVHYRNYSDQYNSPVTQFMGSNYGSTVTIYNGDNTSFPTTAGSTLSRAADIRLYF